MIIKATQKNTRQTARKVRLVANQIKKLPLMDAINQLAVIEKKSTLVLLKVVRQAIANAIHNHGFTLEDLTIKAITVIPAPQLKRFRAVSRGRAHTIVKRTCHITVELEAAESKNTVPASKKIVPAVKKVTKTKKTEVDTKVSTPTRKMPTEKVVRKIIATQKILTKASNTKQKKGQAK
ncbi:MAG: 50S ribosomal protein L22 [Candidatus Pacebacteria bacterium CG_4_10_14_3_um_filter_34_15]|nr:50S ribosomal protein L22 [Candidatus Pacearchaeota archaeon]NCQ65251.1 50S ribosomal protein L22 [Candidatus Paceibacterota bacterium]PIQ81030.1 MAG: 50S ribosomal protein L22 [Candidatus Pacebacteria bacterium CG11_big_fil_rev_8_21_14_0_20_34_55]PIX81847.1 MAG: 50S ribosomal protein L22 [Candidatus Pacebacteria bacterium CG_4_10_14_3_um_filter_34_15]PJC44062.1 MAG: 50S ribosomal protein L22 [Candidatus Pacebacteria bacterium CG_4_9_14_0_2_um_filter_34_50]